MNADELVKMVAAAVPWRTGGAMTLREWARLSIAAAGQAGAAAMHAERHPNEAPVEHDVPCTNGEHCQSCDGRYRF